MIYIDTCPNKILQLSVKFQAGNKFSFKLPAKSQHLLILIS